MKDRHLIVISMDAMGTMDLDILKTLPNFKYVMDKGSIVKNVKSIYPSLTYPAHVTLVTGKYPREHGVINNTLLQVEEERPDWFFQRKYVKCETLYDLFINNGLSTCALFWPVTGKSKIKYNMPEIFPTRNKKNQILLSLLNGSPLFQIKLKSLNGHILNGIKEPELDDFTLENIKYVFKNIKPNLLLCHLIDIDEQRHVHGVYGEEAVNAIKRQDKRLGEIIKSLKDNGMYEKSTIIVLGDHFSIDVHTRIQLNVLFKKHDLIKIENSKIVDYNAYAKTCDGSTYIYLKNENSEVKALVVKILNEFKESFDGIEAIYNSKEIAKLGADDSAFLMVEAKSGYYFTDDFNGEVIKKVDGKNIKKNGNLMASHGYNPNKDGYGTLFMGMGVGIKKNIIVDGANLVDIPTTLGEIMNLKLKNSSGNVIHEILGKEL